MKQAKISGSSPATAAVVYDRLKGVDFSTDPGLIAPERSPYAPNLISGAGGYPEKRPGWRTVQKMGKEIFGLHAGRIENEDVYLAHCGDEIFRWWPYDETGEKTPVSMRGGVLEHYSQSFVHQDRIFILTGSEYLVCGMTDGVLTIRPVSEVAKIPTVLFNAHPLAGGGLVLEERNLITNYRTVGFVGNGDGEHWEETGLYFLPDEKIGEGKITIKVRNQETLEWEEYTEIPQGSDTLRFKTYIRDPNGPHENEETGNMHYNYYPKCRGVWWHLEDNYWNQKVRHFIVDRTYGVIGMYPAPWDNSGSGSDNVEITYEKVPEADQDNMATINACDIVSSFDNRIFLAGNPAKPAYDWHSAAEDPTYFPESGYAMVGAGGSAIMGYRALGNAQVIVKEDRQQDAGIYLRTPTELNGKTVFSLQQGVSGQGAVAKRSFANLLDDPLYLSRNGVYAITSNLVTAERTLVNRSRFIDPRLTKEVHLEEAVSCSWNGMYLLSMTDGTVYLLDGKQNKVYQENSLTGAGYNYEAYHWTNMPATVWLPEAECLFFGTKDGRICRLNTDVDGVEKYNDDGAPIYAARATRMEFCGDFLRYKTMIKKGSGLLMQPYSRSSVTVYARTDRTQAEEFFRAGLDDFDWQGETLGPDYAAWESAQVIPFKKKIKKWKWIQLIAENNEINEGFGVYGMILRHQKLNLV